MAAFNNKLYQAHRGVDNNIYMRSSSDGTNWGGWVNQNGTSPSSPFLQAFNSKFYQTHQGTDDKIYTRSSSDGANWTGWQESGGLTPIDRDAVTPAPNGAPTAPGGDPVGNSTSGTEIETSADPSYERIGATLNKFLGVKGIKAPGGGYPGQCVSFVKQYTQALGFPMKTMGGTGQGAGGAKFGFINFNKPGLSLSAAQATKITYTQGKVPKVGDIIFFNSTPRNSYGHIAVVHQVLSSGNIVIQESNGDAKAPNTFVKRVQLNLKNSNRGSVMGWLRLKL